MRALNGEALDNCFASIERAACEGARCPTNGNCGVETAYVIELARQGRIRIEISGHNYRTVTILTGPNAGKRTRPDPSGRMSWRVFDTIGGHRVEGFTPVPKRGMRPQPFAPRLLAR